MEKRRTSPGKNNKDNATNSCLGGGSGGLNDGNTTNSGQHLGAGEERDYIKCKQNGKMYCWQLQENYQGGWHGTLVISNEVIRECCQVKSAESWVAYNTLMKSLGGSQHFIGANIIQTFEQVIVDE